MPMVARIRVRGFDDCSLPTLHGCGIWVAGLRREDGKDVQARLFTAADRISGTTTPKLAAVLIPRLLPYLHPLET